MTNLKRLQLDSLHRRLGGRMVPFAGYEMPVRYTDGIIGEHLHCRTKAALFDVSHMGQLVLRGEGAAETLERLVPGDILGLKPGRQRYTLFLNEAGGIIDDVIVANYGGRFLLVVNASRKEADMTHLRRSLAAGMTLEHRDDRSALALQGPLAASVLARLWPGARALAFMGVAEAAVAGIRCWISRSGYTGEDGFELSCPAEGAARLATAILEMPEVAPAGLGARDSLRLEAGLPLYGQDLDEETTPVEAGLAWTIASRRRESWGFPGAAVIRTQLADGPTRRRVGIRLDGRQPARSGAPILGVDSSVSGVVTSGGFSPTLNAPVAMGYVRSADSLAGTALALVMRGKPLSGHVVPLPFVPHRYFR